MCTCVSLKSGSFEAIAIDFDDCVFTMKWLYFAVLIDLVDFYNCFIKMREQCWLVT